MGSPFLIAGLILGIIYVIIYVILIPYISNTNKKQKLPPGRRGWPVIGESLSFVSNPGKFVRERMAKHSPVVFRTHIAGEDMVILGGAEGNKFIFTNDNKLIKPWFPKGVTKTLNIESSFFPSPIRKDHSFLKVDSLQKYVSLMDSTCRDHMEKNWVPHDTVKVFQLAKKFTFSLTCRLFINCDDQQMADLMQPFITVVEGLVSAPIDFPGTTFHAAIKAGDIVREKIRAIIRQRKTELMSRNIENDNNPLQGHSDLLTKLLLSTDNNGIFYNQEDIVKKIAGYLVGSFVSTSNTITFVLSHLADHPHVYAQVFKEQQDIVESKEAGELLTWEDLQKMRYSWNVLCESMRIMSSPMMIKEAVTNFTYSGFDIPKGWKVMWTPTTTSKDPNYFPDPEKFDPSRFEKNGPRPYTFAPFGGGPNMCPGKEYARIIIMVLVHNVVTRFKLEKVNPNEKIFHTPLPTPAEDLPMQLQPHEK